jgi:hypothetical protein
MTLTVNDSWKLRKKLVARPRTYEQALAIYNYSMQVSKSRGSRAGGHHAGLGDVLTRQYPLLLPYWSRTYVGMLPKRTNAGRVDNTMYTNNDQVPEGRIAFYYAPSGGYSSSGTSLSNSLELVCWHPDGRCILNPAVSETFQWGRRSRAECFADVQLYHVQQRRCIKTSKTHSGLWKHVPLPISQLSEGDYRRSNEIKDDKGNGTGFYNHWKRDYSNLFIWNDWGPLVIPKNRRERPYALRGVADWPYVAATLTNPIPRLSSWQEEARVRKQRARIHMKMAGIVRSMQHNPQELQYFLGNYRHTLGIPEEIRERRTATNPVATTPRQAEPLFLKAGSRHNRRVFLDEFTEEVMDQC